MPIYQHVLDKYGLMEGEQRGAIRNWSGKVDNMLIKGMVSQTVRR